ncbi:hypothetical protein [Desulfovibrio sp. An276]|uniref:hypothetical protein n=1 Tax=Desulfovibrio sp. An276 TaxID=1965618 RepID=UPI0013A5F610|nr:hypothetical protein [Desulfovibrio sp. An276]
MRGLAMFAPCYSQTGGLESGCVCVQLLATGPDGLPVWEGKDRVATLNDDVAGQA